MVGLKKPWQPTLVHKVCSSYELPPRPPACVPSMGTCLARMK